MESYFMDFLTISIPSFFSFSLIALVYYVFGGFKILTFNLFIIAVILIFGTEHILNNQPFLKNTFDILFISSAIVSLAMFIGIKNGIYNDFLDWAKEPMRLLLISGVFSFYTVIDTFSSKSTFDSVLFGYVLFSFGLGIFLFIKRLKNKEQLT